MLILIQDYYGSKSLKFNIEEIRSNSRRADLVRHRRTICALLRNAGYSLPVIGAFINRSHCSVIHLLDSKGWLKTRVAPEPDPKHKKKSLMRRIFFHEKEIARLRKLL